MSETRLRPESGSAMEQDNSVWWCEECQKYRGIVGAERITPSEPRRATEFQSFSIPAAMLRPPLPGEPTEIILDGVAIHRSEAIRRCLRGLDREQTARAIDAAIDRYYERCAAGVDAIVCSPNVYWQLRARIYRGLQVIQDGSLLPPDVAYVVGVYGRVYAEQPEDIMPTSRDIAPREGEL